MSKYTINNENYCFNDVNNALSLHSMSVKFEDISDKRTYYILHNNSFVYMKNRIVYLYEKYKNKLNLLNKIKSRRKLLKMEPNHKVTFLIRCIIWGEKFKKNDRKYSDKFYDQYKRILAQIYQSYKLNKMIWISRSNNTYTKKELCRYFSYIFNTELLSLTFDLLEDLGYIDGVGFEKGNRYTKKKSSRYILSGICKIFDRINGRCEFKTDKHKEVVILKEDIVKWKRVKTKKGGYIYVKNTTKKLKNYKDNEFTYNRRAFIDKLNAFYESKKIEVESSNILLQNSFLPILYYLIINNRIFLNRFVVEHVDDANESKFAINNMIHDRYNVNELDRNKNSNLMNLKHILCLKMAADENLDYQRVYDGHVFVKELKFEILDKSVRSIFNRGSFDHGGRFYGSVVTELPKILRKCLLIDGEPVLSGDFKAFHIYLAYHLAGEKCPMDDPYKLPNTNREEMKLASLVAINAPDLDSAVFGTMNKINKSLSKYKADASLITEEQAECLVTTFMYNHKVRIASDYGVTLQNRDSIIMQDALNALMDESICGLGVHDEIIVPAQHIDRAVEIMIQAYKKQPFTNGFEPVVDVKRDKFEIPCLGVPYNSNELNQKKCQSPDDGLGKAA